MLSPRREAASGSSARRHYDSTPIGGISRLRTTAGKNGDPPPPQRNLSWDPFGHSELWKWRTAPGSERRNRLSDSTETKKRP